MSHYFCWSAVATKQGVLPGYRSMMGSEWFCWNILFPQSQNVFTFINLFVKGHMNKSSLTFSNLGWHILLWIKQEFQHLPELKWISEAAGYIHMYILLFLLSTVLCMETPTPSARSRGRSVPSSVNWHLKKILITTRLCILHLRDFFI